MKSKNIISIDKLLTVTGYILVSLSLLSLLAKILVKFI